MNNIEITHVVNYIVEEIKTKGYVYQENLVQDINTKFGEEFTYINLNGNLAIDKKVLKEFKKQKEIHSIEWDKSGRCWHPSMPNNS